MYIYFVVSSPPHHSPRAIISPSHSKTIVNHQEGRRPHTNKTQSTRTIPRRWGLDGVPQTKCSNYHINTPTSTINFATPPHPPPPNRNKQMELGWAGRSGGLDARPTSKGGSRGGGAAGGGLPRVGRAGYSSGRQQGSSFRAAGSDGEEDFDARGGGAAGEIGGGDLARSSSAPVFPGSGGGGGGGGADGRHSTKKLDRGGGGSRRDGQQAKAKKTPPL